MNESSQRCAIPNPNRNRNRKAALEDSGLRTVQAFLAPLFPSFPSAGDPVLVFKPSAFPFLAFPPRNCTVFLHQVLFSASLTLDRIPPQAAADLQLPATLPKKLHRRSAPVKCSFATETVGDEVTSPEL